MLTYFHRSLLPGLLIFCLAPLLLLTCYNQPYWDDYSGAAYYRQLGAVASLQYLYQHSGGRFISNICFTLLNPLSYGWLGGVKVFALLAIGLQIGSVIFAIQASTQRRLTAWQASWYSLGLWLIFVFVLPDIHSSLYWFSSLVVHQLACCLLLMVPAAVARAHQSLRHRRAWLLLAAAATLLTAGMSELVVLLLGLVLLTASSRSAYKKQYGYLRHWLGLLLALGAGFSLALAAPGNYARMAASSPKVPLSVLGFVMQFGQGLRLVMWQPVFFALLLVPMLFIPLGSKLLCWRPIGFRLPLLVGALVVLLGIMGGTCVLSILISPTLLARGVNVLYWWTLFGWLAACWASLPDTAAQPVAFSPAVRTLVAALLVVVFTAPTIRAWQEALGEAPRWAAQCEARNAVYLAASNKHVKLTVPPITNVTPYYVLVRGYDIQPYYNHPLNVSLAHYFQLDSVQTDAKWPVPASF